jgi:EAL domain-containing protein (putative c-di-GMP-specific phosphodiesterase class I)
VSSSESNRRSVGPRSRRATTKPPPRSLSPKGTPKSAVSPIEEAARAKQLFVVFQPIVDLRTGKPFAYEALVRSKAPAFPDPPAILSAAIESRAMGRIGRVIREMAAEDCPDAPLFLNIHPNELDDSWLVRPDDPIFAHEHPIYLEITESVPLTHFRFCHGVLSEVRGRGANLAVDDLGAGYSNLKYIADLNPEVVKLDRDLVAGLRVSTRLHKLVAAIVRLCNDMGAQVVAEGIETYDEFMAARDAGCQLGQGYYFARPATPKPSYDWKKLSNPPPQI